MRRQGLSAMHACELRRSGRFDICTVVHTRSTCWNNLVVIDSATAAMQEPLRRAYPGVWYGSGVIKMDFFAIASSNKRFRGNKRACAHMSLIG